MQIRTLRKLASVTAVLLLLLLAGVSLMSLYLQRRTVRAEQRMQRLSLLAAEMRQSSNELTALARDYVATGDPKFRDLYYDILEIRSGKRPRPKHYAPSDWRAERSEGGGELRSLLGLLHDEGVPQETFNLLATSKAESESLAKLEIELMNEVGRLMAQGKTALSDREHLVARMHDEHYQGAKRAIMLAASDFEGAIRAQAFDQVAALQREQRIHLTAAFVIVGIMLATIIPLMFYAERNVLSPLKALGIASARMSRGHYAARAEVTASNELGLLADTFNKMASSISSEMEKVEGLRFALDNVPAFVYMKDRSSRYTNANKATLDLFGCTAEELVGRGDEDFFPPDTVARLREIDLQVLEGKSTDEEVTVGDPAGEQKVYHEVKTPIFDRSGGEAGESIIGLLGISTEITAQKAAQARWRALFDASPDAIILTNTKGLIQLVNQRAVELFGYPQEELIGSLVDMLLPERLRAGHKRHRKGFEGSPSLRPMQGRTNLTARCRDGRLIRVAVGLSQVESHGTKWNMAIVHDMTGHYQMTEKVRLLSAALEQAGSGIAITNPQGVCHWVNPGFERITGYTSDEIVGKRVSVLNSGVHDKEFFRELWETITAGKTWHGEIHNRHRDGHVYVEEQTISPVHDDSGDITHFVAVKQDVTERIEMQESMIQINQTLKEQLAEIEELQERLKEQTIRDPLTGVFNRRYMDDQLSRHVERCRRNGNPVAVVLVDIDHFKNVNDAYGHLAGDRALQEIADLLQTSTRVTDTVCRYGGDEFVVIMPAASLDDAKIRAEALRLAFEEKVIEYEGTEIRTTLSSGVAVFPDHGDDPSALTNAADDALYQAKARGRNRVVGFDEV